MEPIREINDPRLVKALAHPLRVEILTALADRTASPSELAAELPAPLGNISYHVRTLARLGLIELVRQRHRRGAIEHYYRAKGRVRITDRAWAQVPAVVKSAMAQAVLDEIGRYVHDAAAAGGFDNADVHLSRQPLTLDAEGWRQVADALKALLDRAREIQGECEERLAASDHAGERPAGLVMMLFDAPVADQQGPKAEAAPSRSRRTDAPKRTRRSG